MSYLEQMSLKRLDASTTSPVSTNAARCTAFTERDCLNTASNASVYSLETRKPLTN